MSFCGGTCKRSALVEKRGPMRKKYCYNDFLGEREDEDKR